MYYVLGLDIGTSGTKAILYSSVGDKMAESYQSYPLLNPKNGYAEQDAKLWYDATIYCIKNIVDMNIVSPDLIKGIGLSGQMHGLVMLDEKLTLLHNSIIWCDTRAEAECEYINSSMKDYAAYTLNPAIAAFTLPSLLWVKNNLAEVYANIDKILLPKDYVNFMLTGNFTTDVSDASGTGMLDVGKRQWSNEILNHFDIDINWLPQVFESCEVVGDITNNIASLTGLTTDTVVVAGAGDQAAAGLGNGIIHDGEVSMSLGSSGVVFASLDKPNRDEKGRVQTFCHAMPNTWHVMGVTQSACLSLSWFKKNFAKDISYKELDRLAYGIALGSEGLLFLPYLQGERTPHLDNDIRASFIGLSITHKLGHLYRSVLEGVAFSMRDCITVIENIGVLIGDITVSGGGAKSDVWLSIISNITKKTLISRESAESGARGVAILACVGAGVYDDIISASTSFLNDNTTYNNPQQEDSAMADNLYLLYSQLYSLLKDNNRNLAKIR